MRTLQVGDEIVAHQYSSYSHVGKVIRLTRTQAITDRGQRFKLGIGDTGFLDIIGGSKWGPGYWLMTPEIREKIVRTNKVAKAKEAMGRVRYSDLTDEQLDHLIALAPKGNP